MFFVWNVTRTDLAGRDKVQKEINRGWKLTLLRMPDIEQESRKARGEETNHVRGNV